jgi:hypothetical protein
MTVLAVGLENPAGTISKSGRSAAGSAAELEMITAVTVPEGDAHFLGDFKFAVAKGAQGTIFRLYGRASSAAAWTQIDEFECGDYGSYTCSLQVGHKFTAGQQWRVTGQQSTIARMAIRVGGIAKVTSVRDF